MSAGATSAGILPFRHTAAGNLELLIGHMGGPFWARKDERAWSIVKGEYDADAEDPEVAARREFAEETGQPVPAGELSPLGEIRQRSGKRVIAWAVEAAALDPETLTSNTFELEWPPRSGRTQAFPELDRFAWVSLDDARRLLVAAQVEFVDRIQAALADA